jgi:hypothetical protein
MWPLTVKFFEREARGSGFLVVLFLHYKTRYGALGTFSKVAIDSVTSSAYLSVPGASMPQVFRKANRTSLPRKKCAVSDARTQFISLIFQTKKQVPSTSQRVRVTCGRTDSLEQWGGLSSLQTVT